MLGRGPEMGRIYYDADKGAGTGQVPEKKTRVELTASPKEEYRFFTIQFFTGSNGNIAAVIYAKPRTFGMGKGGQAGSVASEMLELQHAAVDKGASHLFLNLYNMGLVNVETNQVKENLDELVAIAKMDGVKVHIFGYGEAGAPPWAKAILPMLIKGVKALARLKEVELGDLSGVYSDSVLKEKMAEILAE